MKANNNSTETPNDKPLRRIVDLGIVSEQLDRAAVEHSYGIGKTVIMSEFSRLVCAEFVRVREHCRDNDLKLYTPQELADMLIAQLDFNK
ncbi:MAG: hypothetical protein WAU01_14690 [Saprospiraceae bacterium]